jgi:predicted component of type VI protein secretion system
VTTARSSFTIVVQAKGQEPRRCTFDKPGITIGRVAGNDIILPKGNVSKRHCRLVVNDGYFLLSDGKSTGGTYVNGRKITSPLVLSAGDRIYVGDFILHVEDLEGRPPLPWHRAGKDAPPLWVAMHARFDGLRDAETLTRRLTERIGAAVPLGVHETFPVGSHAERLIQPRSCWQAVWLVPATDAQAVPLAQLADQQSSQGAAVHVVLLGFTGPGEPPHGAWAADLRDPGWADLVAARLAEWPRPAVA